ncbi:cysteine desulfurase IscS [Alphaproteobacteria bacterium]|nr:cysteine desulfurase IscS [Alphaproteobacteria bacterium]GHS97916.1 cysteine desulfurase IscS [Alphaproteobacteria bacterium]
MTQERKKHDFYGLEGVIYLDYPATTPCDPRVFEKMEPYFYKFFGNPSSRNHAYGWGAREAVAIALLHVADFLKVDEREIIFTSGASESNVLALRGVAMQAKLKSNTQANHIITTQVEHHSVSSCCEQLKEEGFRVTYLPVDSDGLINVQQLADVLDAQTLLVSIIAVNNETGVIQPIKDIGDVCAQKNVLFHSDMTQAVGKVPIDLNLWNVGLASFSSHKIYGPKGIGALFMRRKPAVKIRPLLIGGGQQRGLRGGTLPVPLCVGFGEACVLLQDEFSHELPRISSLSQRLWAGLSQIPLATLNGSPTYKVPHIVNVSFPYIEGESLAMGLENICVSTGSACSSERLESSHVLKAMHADEFVVQSSLRFGLGRFTTAQEIDQTIAKTVEEVERLRAMSPVWDMYKEGVDFKTIRWR